MTVLRPLGNSAIRITPVAMGCWPIAGVTSIDVSESDAATLLKLIDALDEDDDVQTVWGNYEVSDEVMERLG